MKRLCELLIALLPVSLMAQPASTGDLLIASLSLCDATLFQTLKRNEALLPQAGKLESKGKIAFWRVGDREDSDRNVLMFSSPIVGRVFLVGYFDELVDLRAMGRYYSWGFLAIGDPVRVAESIKQLVYEGSRLRKNGDLFVRSEISDVGRSDTKWANNDSSTSGTIPPKNKVERVFLIEAADNKYPGFTRIGCSLQGAVSKEMLLVERPDIDFDEQGKAASVQMSSSPFAVGDILIAHRRFDNQSKAVLSGADPEYENTRWKVLEITDQHIKLELIAGEYKPAWDPGRTYKPGFATEFFSSTNYKRVFPGAGNLAQIFDEFKKE